MTYCFLTWSLLTIVTNGHVQLVQFRVIQGILPCDISFELDFIWLQSTTRQATNNYLLNGEAHMCTAGLRTAARRAAVRLVYILLALIFFTMNANSS